MKINKKEAYSDVKKLALGIGGGIAANELNSYVEKQPWASPFAQYVPEATAALAALGVIFLKKGMFKDALMGAAIVSGTEGATTLIHKGIGMMKGEDPAMIEGNDGRQLGFTPQFIPTEFNASIKTVNGFAVR